MNASTARSLALRIHRRFGQQIADACAHSRTVTPDFLAGLISNEAGKYSRSHADVKAGRFSAGDFNVHATRFEPGVYEDLISLRDRGYCFIGGKRRTTYNNITRADIRSASDEAIKALSRSYGTTQIMGWSMVKMLKGTLADLRNPDKHLLLAVERLEIVAKPQLRARQYESAFRIWNTGSPTGKTYDPAYVANGTAVMLAYRGLPNLEPKPLAPDVQERGEDEPKSEDESVAEVVADRTEEPDVDDELEEVASAVGGADDASGVEPDEIRPAQPAPPVEVQQAIPAKDPPDESLAEKAGKTAKQVKAWYVAIPAAIIQFFVAMYKWATDPAHTALVLTLLVGVVVIVGVFIVMNFNHSKEKKRAEEEAAKRDHELKMQREQQAFELTKLQALSAASRDRNSVVIVPQPLQNSDPAQ